jgi:hypothetical protein
MPNRRKATGRRANAAGAKKDSGGTICALCGRTIHEENGDGPVIYSICAACKKLPHRNPGSPASLC